MLCVPALQLVGCDLLRCQPFEGRAPVQWQQLGGHPRPQRAQPHWQLALCGFLARAEVSKDAAGPNAAANSSCQLRTCAAHAARPLRCRVLNFADNPNLSGVLPSSWLPPTLLWLNVRGSNVSACQGGAGTALPGPCSLVPQLAWLTQPSNNAGAPLQCPAAQLRSFTVATQGLTSSAAASITSPIPQPAQPGAVQADPRFTNAQGCACADGSQPTVSVSGSLSCSAPQQGSEGLGTCDWIIIVVLAAVVPHIIVALAVYLYVRYAHNLSLSDWHTGPVDRHVASSSDHTACGRQAMTAREGLERKERKRGNVCVCVRACIGTVRTFTS